MAFRDAEILEVGPGVGHNTLPLLTRWKAKHIDMIEPNPVAADELAANFETMNVDKGAYRIFQTVFEEFEEKKTYDIVIAEGYIQFAANYKEFLSKIREHTHENSIIIITCADEIGLYVERMKRIAWQHAVRDIEKLWGCIDKVSAASDSLRLKKYNEELKEILRICVGKKEIDWGKYNIWKHTF